jgi:hypothetical protein
MEAFLFHIRHNELENPCLACSKHGPTVKAIAHSYYPIAQIEPDTGLLIHLWVCD